MADRRRRDRFPLKYLLCFPLRRSRQHQPGEYPPASAHGNVECSAPNNPAAPPPDAPPPASTPPTLKPLTTSPPTTSPPTTSAPESSQTTASPTTTSPTTTSPTTASPSATAPTATTSTATTWTATSPPPSAPPTVAVPGAMAASSMPTQAAGGSGTQGPSIVQTTQTANSPSTAAQGEQVSTQPQPAPQQATATSGPSGTGPSNAGEQPQSTEATTTTASEQTDTTGTTAEGQRSLTQSRAPSEQPTAPSGTNPSIVDDHGWPEDDEDVVQSAGTPPSSPTQSTTHTQSAIPPAPESSGIAGFSLDDNGNEWPRTPIAPAAMSFPHVGASAADESHIAVDELEMPTVPPEQSTAQTQSATPTAIGSSGGETSGVGDDSDLFAPLVRFPSAASQSAAGASNTGETPVAADELNQPTIPPPTRPQPARSPRRSLLGPAVTGFLRRGSSAEAGPSSQARPPSGLDNLEEERGRLRARKREGPDERGGRSPLGSLLERRKAKLEAAGASSQAESSSSKAKPMTLETLEEAEEPDDGMEWIGQADDPAPQEKEIPFDSVEHRGRRRLPDVAKNCEAFLTLHTPGEPVFVLHVHDLVTAWIAAEQPEVDAMCVDIPTIMAVNWALAPPENKQMRDNPTFWGDLLLELARENLHQFADIAQRNGKFLTADLGNYDIDYVRELLLLCFDAGVVGVDLRDTNEKGHRMFDNLMLMTINIVKKFAREHGLPHFVVNVMMAWPGSVEHAIIRANAYLRVGASCVTVLRPLAAPEFDHEGGPDHPYAKMISGFNGCLGTLLEMPQRDPQMLPIASVLSQAGVARLSYGNHWPHSIRWRFKQLIEFQILS